MPGPVIFGMIIDKTCSLWKYTCGERQSCLLYDIGFFRNAIHTYGLVTSVLATLILSTLYFYFRVKGLTDWGDQLQANATMEKEVHVIADKEFENNGKVRK